MALERLDQIGQALESVGQTDLRMSRRGFLGILAGGALTLAGCSSPAPIPRPNTPEASNFPEGAVILGARDRFIKEINGLPESPIKRALVERVLPYYQQQAPFVLNRSGLEITVYSADIAASKTQKAQTDGTFVMHGPNTPPKDSQIHVAETVKTKVPLPNIIKANEVNSVPKTGLASDNKTFLAELTLNKGAYIPGGVYPNIAVITPYFDLLTPSNRAFHTNLEPFTYIKEACSLLFVDVMLEEMYKKAQELGLPTSAKVQDAQGNIKEAEIITAYWYTLFGFDVKDKTGRTKAAADIAGYLIAMKAVESTNIISELSKDSNFGPALKLLPSIDLGATPHDIWARSFDISISNRDIQILPHTGDINRAP